MVVWREYGCFLAIHGQDEIGLMIRRMGRDNYNSDRCKGDAITLYTVQYIYSDTVEQKHTILYSVQCTME